MNALLRTLLNTFESGDVMLGDAFYGTYFLLAELQSRNVDALFEQHGSRRRSTDFRRGQKLGSRDHLITLTKPKIRPQWMTVEQYESEPGTLTVRELEVGGRVPMTTLTCPNAIPKNALMADVLPRTLSFKHTLQLWLAWSGTHNQPDDQDNITRLLALAAEQSIGNRPGRMEPRAIKRPDYKDASA